MDTNLRGKEYIIKTFNNTSVPCIIPDSINDLQTYFSECLSHKDKHIISFINPEIFLVAEKDSFLLQYLQHTEYNFVDGNGLLMVINRKLGTKYNALNRYPGTDFFKYLPTDKTIKVFLYGAKEENNKTAAEKIQMEYSNIHICGRLNGYEEKVNSDIVSFINQSNPDILIVCLGCPQQESWINENKDKLNSKIIFGNGGSIDFWSGNVKRAPLFMIRHRLEWLFRLSQDFSLKRIRRQSKLIPFSLRILRGSFIVEEKK